MVTILLCIENIEGEVNKLINSYIFYTNRFGVLDNINELLQLYKLICKNKFLTQEIYEY